MSSCEPEY